MEMGSSDNDSGLGVGVIQVSAGRRFLRGLAIMVGGLMPIALVFGLLVLGVVAVRGCT